MKENHRIESLEALSKSASRKHVRRFESGVRVYAYSFDNANDCESWNLISKSQRLSGLEPTSFAFTGSTKSRHRGKWPGVISLVQLS
jgi:hypothetical protein